MPCLTCINPINGYREHTARTFHWILAMCFKSDVIQGFIFAMKINMWHFAHVPACAMVHVKADTI